MHLHPSNFLYRMLLNCHDGSHRLCYIFSSSVLENPLMDIVGNDIAVCLALHSRAPRRFCRFTVFCHSL